MEEPEGLQTMELQSWTQLSDFTFFFFYAFFKNYICSAVPQTLWPVETLLYIKHFTAPG